MMDYPDPDEEFELAHAAEIEMMNEMDGNIHEYITYLSFLKIFTHFSSKYSVFIYFK